jgi:hypothetical protein
MVKVAKTFGPAGGDWPKTYQSYFEVVAGPKDITIDVKFTDKRTHPWKIDNWDNTTWLRGIFDNDRASIDEALEVMDIDGVKELKALVLELIEKGWIKYYNCENINIGKIRPEGYHGMSDLGFGKI